MAKLAIFVKIRLQRLLQVLVQGGQNRDYRTSQNGPCGCLPRLKICLWTSVVSKCWCVSFRLSLILCRRNWGKRKSRFWQISLFGRKSSILRNAHLKLFRASKRVLIGFSSFSGSVHPGTLVWGKFSKFCFLRLLKVLTHPKWSIWENRLSPKFGKIAPFELKIYDGARNGPSRLHVNFELIQAHLKFFGSEKPLLQGPFHQIWVWSAQAQLWSFGFEKFQILVIRWK